MTAAEHKSDLRLTKGTPSQMCHEVTVVSNLEEISNVFCGVMLIHSNSQNCAPWYNQEWHSLYVFYAISHYNICNYIMEKNIYLAQAIQAEV